MNYPALLFPDFSLIALGYLLCRYTALNRPIWQAAETLVYYLLFPVLLFHSVVKSPIDLQAAANLIAAGVALAVIGTALAYAVPHLPGLKPHIDRHDWAGTAQVAFRFNSFIALAISGPIAGAEGQLMMAILVGIYVPLVNISAVWPMARGRNTGFVRELVRNPLIIATALGLAANLAGFRMPALLEPTVTRIGAASLALGLMAAGAGMQFASLAKAKALAVSMLLIRHLLLPVTAWLLAWALQLDTTQTTVLLAFSAVPTASSCYVLAVKMGYNGPFVAGLVTLSTLLGMLSLPFALGVLGQLPR
ncbi:transporter [Comamonas serinivorans]|uniref:Transporter n=1 Tax=Comamonas serinivorans TaxID=1082851 RepID=A0A1Y0ELN1_9BURK|nr:AEC family transporter [Comamonas serinivorans]ARU04212.1 transporter [Comamonas serinivorans]